jgi:predicted DNA-binding transcriptional regulator AlpA
MNSKYQRLARQSPTTQASKIEPISSDDALLSTEEVAAMIGKSPAWLIRKRWEGGGIPYRKIGRHVRYQRSVVLKWLNAQPQLTSTTQQGSCN